MRLGGEGNVMLVYPGYLSLPNLQEKNSRKIKSGTCFHFLWNRWSTRPSGFVEGIDAIRTDRSLSSFVVMERNNEWVSMHIHSLIHKMTTWEQMGCTFPKSTRCLALGQFCIILLITYEIRPLYTCTVQWRMWSNHCLCLLLIRTSSRTKVK